MFDWYSIGINCRMVERKYLLQGLMPNWKKQDYMGKMEGEMILWIHHKKLFWHIWRREKRI